MSEVHWIIREFIENNIELIDNDEFDTLYNIARNNSPVLSISSLTDTLDDVGIPTLPYLTVIPQGYLRHSRNSHKYVKIPAKVKAIEANAFSGTDMQELTFEEGCEEILNNAFSMCPDLVNVTLPRSLKKIGSRIFNGCAQLNNINYLGTIEDWNNIDHRRMWFTANPQFYRSLQIVCSDGVIELFKEE